MFVMLKQLFRNKSIVSVLFSAQSTKSCLFSEMKVYEFTFTSKLIKKWLNPEFDLFEFMSLGCIDIVSITSLNVLLTQKV